MFVPMQKEKKRRKEDYVPRFYCTDSVCAVIGRLRLVVFLLSSSVFQFLIATALGTVLYTCVESPFLHFRFSRLKTEQISQLLTCLHCYF